MAVELTAVRLMAPYFGDSAFVWTNVIGVILLALAVGAFAGGIAADRGAGTRVLAGLLLGGACLVALAAVAARRVALWFMDPALPLDAAFGVMVRGSLASTFLLFAPPVLLLGAVPPLLIKLRVGRDGDAALVGRASGLVYAAATLGSLVGTFLPTHLLVPGIGSRGTILAAAGVLAAAGLLVLGRRAGGRGRAAGAAAVLWLVTAAATGGGPIKDPLPGERLLHEKETAYQYLQVVEGVRPMGAGEAVERRLKINEGLDSFHSVTVAGEDLTGGLYYDWFALLPAFFPPGQRLRMLSLGSSGGTFQRIYAALFGQRVERFGVELDPATVRAGVQFLDAPRDQVREMDARLFLALSKDTFHLMLSDTYRHQIYLPAHLASVQFLERARDRLAEGGILALNVGGFSFGSAVVRAVANNVASVFGEALVLRVRGGRNFLVLGRRGEGLDPGPLGRGEGLPAALQELGRVAALPGSWRRVRPDPTLPLLTDDRPFLDALHHRLYAGEEVEAVRAAGEAAPQGTPREHLEARIEELLEVQELEQAAREGLEYVRRAPGAPRLRALAAEALWRTGRIQEAASHYRAALESPESWPELREHAGRALERLGGEKALRARARRLERRGTAVGLAGAVLLLGLLLGAAATSASPRGRN